MRLSVRRQGRRSPRPLACRRRLVHRLRRPRLVMLLALKPELTVQALLARALLVPELQVPELQVQEPPRPRALAMPRRRLSEC